MTVLESPERPEGKAPTQPQPPREPVTPRRLPAPLRPRNFGWADAGLLGACALSSLALVWVVFYQLTLLSGGFGFLLCWYVCFMVFYWAANSKVIERQVATDRMVAVLVLTAAAILVGLVIFIVLWVTFKAIPHIHWGALFTKDQKRLVPSDPHVLSNVGVLHAIVGTLEQVGLAAIIGVPVAIATAVFLNEVGGKGTRMVRTVVTAMSGTPSIVAGVFIYAILIINHVLSFSGFAASLALFIMLLPSVTRTTEEVLRVVPSGLREASLALGAPQWRTVWSVVLPTARSGLTTAIVLGIARIVGETAPLLFTAFGSQVLNLNAFSGAQGALPLVVYHDVQQAQAVFIALAFEAAFVLMWLVLILFIIARILGRTRAKKDRGFALRIFERSLVPTRMASSEPEAESFTSYAEGISLQPGDLH